jgi:hypothetical protein
VAASPRGGAPKGLALHELHRDVGSGVGPADLVNGDDVGMVQGGGRASLPFETLKASRVGGKFFRKNFDRDFATEPCVPGAVNLAHTSRAERARLRTGRDAIPVRRPFASRSYPHEVPSG